MRSSHPLETAIASLGGSIKDAGLQWAEYNRKSKIEYLILENTLWILE